MSYSKNIPAALITGGGRGIGRAISLRLARTMPVLLVGRTKADLKATCEEIREAGGVADFYVGDISHPETAEQAIALVRRNDWQLGHVICNAGIGKSSSTHELATDQWHAVIDTNLNSCFYLIRAALPLFLERSAGTFCFISSIGGIKGYAYEAAYTASKHAVVGLAKSVALEYGKHGIVSVPICPGFVESDMTTRTITSLANRRSIPKEEAREVIERINPQRRIIPAEEVAEMVAFVCANTVPSLSGSPIIMSGGI